MQEIVISGFQGCPLSKHMISKHMMKKFSVAWVLLAFLLLLTSCKAEPVETPLDEEDPIWDIAPVEVILVVTDAQGNNLFDASTPGNWLSEPFSATFNGEEFQWPPARTREYFAELKGFYIYPSGYSQSKEVFLRFGELDGERNWDTDLSISWPDGSEDVIRVQHTFRWGKKGPETYHTAFKLNGTPVEGEIVRLKK